MIYLSDVQQNKIDGIVDQYVDACRKSNKETAYQDAERKGMDAVRKYCKQAGLPLLGDHMIKASNTLSNI
jgi:hypothetical protein|tara:strand:- start:301 stop:510 length:210 start_codon:yes stop_codon:yes gene_type:complete